MGFTPTTNDAEEMARQAAYFGKPGDITIPVTTIGGPTTPPPAPDPAVAGYWGAAPAAPPETMDQAVERARVAMLAPSPPPPTPPPAPAGPPSMASLRAGSAAMNAQEQGAPPPQAAPVDPHAERAAAALAHYGGAATKPKAGSGSGGGSSGSSDPFGVKAARKGMYGTYDAEEQAMQRGATNEEGRADTMASGMNVLAQQQQQEAERQAVQSAHEAELFRMHMEESQRQLDDIRAQKVDPNRLYSDSGSKALAVIGGVIGGLYQGLNRMEKNPFIEDMNRGIQQDIALQERELARQTDGVKERRNLLSDMRAVYKDESVAKIQAQNLMYEGAKQKLAAEAATYDSPAIQAKADQGIQALDREQKKLKLGDAMQSAAQAQAAAASARALQQQQFENALKVQHANTEARKADAEMAKADQGKGATLRSRFVATGKDPTTGEPTGYLDSTAEGASKRTEARIAAQRLITKIDRAIEIRNQEGALGRTLNRNDPKDSLQLYKPEWQTQLNSLRAEMTTDWAHAKGLGALSGSDHELADGAIGDMTSRGRESEVRLLELKRTLETGIKAEDEASAGVRVRMHGDESIDPIGGSNAPTNSRTGSAVRREKP